MERNLEQVLRMVVLREADGGNDHKDIHIWVRRLGAPVTHRFAAGDKGVTSQDVATMVGKSMSLLNKPFQDCTPLDLAIASNNAGGLETLLQMGADPNTKNGIKNEMLDGSNFPAHPIVMAIYFRRPKCLKILLESNSSFADMYPDKLNEIAHLAVCHIDGSPVGTKASERIIEVLLATKEGRDAFTSAHPDHHTTPLMGCLYMLCALKPFNDPKSLERTKVREDSLTKVIEMLLKAGTKLSHDIMEFSPFALACGKGIKPKVASLLLKYGADPNGYMAHNGHTCLYSAIENDQVEIVKKLLSKGADVNGIGPNSFSPFRLAHEKGSKAILKVLVNQPSFRFKTVEYGYAKSMLSKEQLLSPEDKHYSYWMIKDKKVSPVPLDEKIPSLIQLASQGSADKLADMLAKCSIADLNAQTHRAGMTALHAATNKNDFEIVELLLEKGAKPNIKDSTEMYPLMYAVKNPNALEIIDVLLSNGADINAQGGAGETALFVAVKANRVENVEYLCTAQNVDVNIGETVSGTTPLHLMTQKNNLQIMEILLKAPSANVNAINSFGATPLHYASKWDKKKAAKYLIGKGASIDMKCTVAGNTPLHVAAACDSTEVAQLLIDKGANVEAQNHNGETPLFLAAMTGHEPMITLLIEEEVKIDTKNIHGQSPLYIAITYQHYEVARILMNNGASIMAREKHRNETILHLATAIGNIEYASFLIGRGVDKEAKDAKGMTPLLRSAIIHNGDVAMALIELGCNTSATLDSKPRRVNFLDLVVSTNNVSVLEEVVNVCRKTKKLGFHPALNGLHKESKEAALSLWTRHFELCH